MTKEKKRKGLLQVTTSEPDARGLGYENITRLGVPTLGVPVPQTPLERVLTYDPDSDGHSAHEIERRHAGMLLDLHTLITAGYSIQTQGKQNTGLGLSGLGLGWLAGWRLGSEDVCAGKDTTRVY